jgi:hypothetical protein
MPVTPIDESTLTPPQVKTKAVKAPAGTIAAENFTLPVKDSSPFQNRVELPSKGFFYTDIKTVCYRPFKVKDLNKVQQFLRTNNVTHLIDAIQNCIGDQVDVRELTRDDFFFLAYQIAFSSHIDPKFTFEWSSFYENINMETITPSTLQIVELNEKQLKAEVANYKDLKFTPGLVKHYEILHNNGFKEEEESIWDEENTLLYEQVAQYLDEATPAEQLARAEQIEVRSEEYLQLKKFIPLSQHNIKTELSVSDRHFEADKALAILKERYNRVLQLPEDSYEEMLQSSAGIYIEKSKIKTEIERIETALALSQEVRAMTEVTPFRFAFRDIVQPLFL